MCHNSILGSKMARAAMGLEALEAAKEAVAKTKCAKDLRIAQAVVFPLAQAGTAE